MTIAVCYMSPEGVVLGADSTSSAPCEIGLHYFNFNQKVFEIGEGSTLGMLTWGLGGLDDTSYRTLIALLADDLKATPAVTVADVAQRWVDLFWGEYSSFPFKRRFDDLNSKSPYDPAANPSDPGIRTEEEEREFSNLSQSLVVGFCLAGYVPPDRTTEAAVVTFDPLQGKPTPQISHGWSSQWWGVPNIISRLIHGADHNLISAIIASGHWKGAPSDLEDLVQQQALQHSTLPIRDAIDYVHACIYTTIKAMKFSNMPQVCGGPIEIAVITTDRKFRWVRHKHWDAAITDGVTL